jgi:hypothetical protein
VSKRTVVVRYRLKPARVAEHEALLAAVFAELAANSVSGVEYRALKLDDGVTFVHVADVDGANNPLVALPSFQAFTRDIADRCVDPPISDRARSMWRHVVRSTT